MDEPAGSLSDFLEANAMKFESPLPSTERKPIADRRLVTDRSPAPQEPEAAIDILQVLSRQRWVIVFCMCLGLALGVLYAMKATVWYESTANVLINSRNPTSDAGASASDMLDEDVLANHMEILRSRKIVEAALTKDGLMDLPSIQPWIDKEKGEDAADYVIERLEIVKGGEGAAKTARSLHIAFAHTDPAETRQILDSVLVEYQTFIASQLESVMLKASDFVSQAKNQVEQDLRAAEQEYLVSRKAAPLLFQGVGSSNVYQDKYRRLEEELLSLDIEESSLSTRLERVHESLKTMGTGGEFADHLDKLALIDSDSLTRLGLFAGLQMNTAKTADFQAAQPARMAEAQAQVNVVLQLMSEKQRLTQVFGPGHPKVQDIEEQIALTTKFLSENKETTDVGLGDGMLNPEALLKAYIGFLEHDLAALKERKVELQILAKDAESQAKALIDYELQDTVLKTKIERQEALFDGVVQQLRQMDTASGLSGYIYELLEAPRVGVKSWPKLPLCGLGGLMLGLFGGLFLAVSNDLRDGRFHSAVELENFVNVPILGRVGKISTPRRGPDGRMVSDLTPEAEAIRMMRTLLLPDIRAGKLRTLGITSPMQGDGKSTVLSNLAVSFSQLGTSVLIIDADLRRPSLQNYFGGNRIHGLSEVLIGEAAVDDNIRGTNFDGVSFIAAGGSTTTPAELLQSDKFDKLIAEMTARFDVVLVDLPPVLAVSDPLVAAPKLGGMIMAIRASSARKSEVLNSLRRLESANAKIVGCILNTFGVGKKFISDGGSYGYYNNGYSQPTRTPLRPAPRPLAAANGEALASQASEQNDDFPAS